MNIKNSWPKIIISWLTCLVVRLIPLRAPNLEPILATQMPLTKKYGAIAGFVYGFLSIVLFDLIVGKTGIWTLITGVAYGLVGLGAWWFFKNRASKVINYVGYSVIATILYDAATGLSIGPLFFHQSFMQSLTGQIPFTAMHLVGNIALAIIISPLLYRWVVVNENLETKALWQRVFPKNKTVS
ncbi:MAG: hypothetical protein PHV78_00730 [Patescibacteria group bacterium]|nr:hypothetical protein [Patescibacteria group bacterium]MDD5121307.1 hypothetical protein [Patescibacteria group bacterium]MDD5221737.1 hypothetical protein [Patescibacteria group bacterium]MDD5395774.1 hypothetical protein [Patescibacteria group bacterium]